MSHPTGRMNRTKQKPKDFRSAMRDIFKYCKPWYTPIMAALLFSVGSIQKCWNCGRFFLPERGYS